jgi:amidase
MDERAFASATQLAGDIRDRRVGCLELLDHFVARAERYNPTLNIVIAWQLDKARSRARAADAALARSEIWGRCMACR